MARGRCAVGIRFRRETGDYPQKGLRIKGLANALISIDSWDVFAYICLACDTVNLQAVSIASVARKNEGVGKLIRDVIYVGELWSPYHARAAKPPVTL